MKVVLEGKVGDTPIVVCVPDGWTGEIEVRLHVHKGSASKKVRVVKHTVHELGAPILT